MKRILIFILAASFCAFAQERGDVIFRTAQRGGIASVSTFDRSEDSVVQGAPYSATFTTTSVQTLADGNRITQSSKGSISRDSEGRTRRDMPLPAIGNLSAKGDAPHLVFIQDPVNQVAYTLNLTDKTAQKLPEPPMAFRTADRGVDSGATKIGDGAQTKQFFIRSGGPGMPLPPPPALALMTDDRGQVKSENLGSQTMEGVVVNGTRTTRTIPAGEIGNEKPIEIVTEVWTSPDLKTIVYSKRTDPRMGEETFQLTNIERSEPDASLFTVPQDFKVTKGPRPVIYRRFQ